MRGKVPKKIGLLRQWQVHGMKSRTTSGHGGLVDGGEGEEQGGSRRCLVWKK